MEHPLVFSRVISTTRRLVRYRLSPLHCLIVLVTGALFDYHPPLTNATVVVEDANHPSTSHLPARWEVEDEMYNFRSDPRSVGAVVLLSADESSYTGWCWFLFFLYF